MVEHLYQSPVDRLLTYGDAREFSEWPDYTALGLTVDHVPELLRMATDPELNLADMNSLEVWAPIHALRALGQLRVESAIEPLVKLLDKADDDDWLYEELPEVFATIGPAAIPALSNYLRNMVHPTFGRVVAAADGLMQIVQKYPEQRQVVVERLTDELGRIEQDDPAINGFLISNLVDLHATESAAAIKAAFYARMVDTTICGDWYAVREALGIDPAVEIPGPDPEHENLSLAPLAALDTGPHPVRRASKAAKSKRKQEKKSRQKNRKKKK